MFFQFHLNLLVNFIITTHFPNSFCFIQMYDNDTNPVNLYAPHYLIDDLEGFQLDQQKECRNFLLECKSPCQAFTKVETVIKYQSDGMYHNRKYLVILTNSASFEEFFNSTYLPFVRDILIIHAKNEYFLIEPDNSFISEDNAYVFELYTHQYIGVDGNNDPVLLDVWYGLNQSFQYGNNLYPDKITNQEGRELRCPCFKTSPYANCLLGNEATGKEHMVILKYASWYNFSLILYTDLEYGNIYRNWSSEDSRGGLVTEDNYYDIIYGGFPKSFHVDTIKTDRYICEISVPKPKIRYGWLWIVNIFKFKIWILIVASFVFVYLLVKVRRCLLSSGIPLIGIIGLYVSQPPPYREDVKKSVFLRFIMVLILLSNCLYVGLYNTRFASVMMAPEFEDDIKTLTDLAQSNYNIIFFDEYYTILKEDTREVYNRLYQKAYYRTYSHYDGDFYYAMDKLIASRKYAVARFRRSSGGYNEDESVLETMHSLFKPITPELFVSYYYFLLRKNSMHTEGLKQIVTIAEETGLMTYWEQADLRKTESLTFQMKLQDVKVTYENRPLNMKKLKGLFTFWSICISVSMITFLVELCWGESW